MRTWYRIGTTGLLIVSVVSLVTVSSEAGQGLFVRSGRAKTHLPCNSTKYSYGEDDARIVTVVDSGKAISLENVTLSHGLTNRLTQVHTSTAINGTRRDILEESAAQLANPIPTKSKRFVISPATAGPVAMTLPGAILYDTGDFRFSCTLSHSGGRFKNLSGNRCTIRVQGLRGSLSDRHDPRTTLTAPVLFELTKTVRVSSSRPTTVQMTDCDLKRMAKFFAEISHIRVYVECRLDR